MTISSVSISVAQSGVILPETLALAPTLALIGRLMEPSEARESGGGDVSRSNGVLPLPPVESSNSVPCFDRSRGRLPSTEDVGERVGERERGGVAEEELEADADVEADPETRSVLEGSALVLVLLLFDKPDGPALPLPSTSPGISSTSVASVSSLPPALPLLSVAVDSSSTSSSLDVTKANLASSRLGVTAGLSAYSRE